MAKLSQKSLIYKVLKLIKDNCLIQSGDQIVVALSGGVDSIVLFDILYQLQKELNFTLAACHYNHAMRGQESDGDAEFVQKLCADRGIELIVEKTHARLTSEESAREARYSFFQKILEQGRGETVKIALAHNADDLVETALMRLTRGTGLQGLNSIPLQRKNFIRPLLYFQKKEIRKYAQEQGLKFVEDSTNTDIAYTRNYFRHKIIPLFLDCNPNFVDTLLQSILTIQSDYTLLAELGQQAYLDCLISDSNKIILNHKQWLTLHPSLQYQTLRIAIGQLSSLTDITSTQLQEVYKMLQKGEGGKHKLLPHSLFIGLSSGKITMYKKD